MNNRQNGRRGRGRGGNNGGIRPMGGGGGQDRGNRIDNRARGNANQLHEKYKTLARDAQMQGDRVMTEYYLQFADHYFRVLAETRGRFDEQRPQQQRRDFNDDYDGDDADGGDELAAEGGQQEREPRREYRRDDRRADERNQQDDRGDRRASGQYNGDAQDERREREPRYERREREDRPREERARDDRPREMRDDRGEARTPQPEAAIAENAEPPRRGRGRPRRERQPEADDAGADRIALPSFLSEGVTPPAPPPAAVDAADGEDAPAPRRRVRRPRADPAAASAEV